MHVGVSWPQLQVLQSAKTQISEIKLHINNALCDVLGDQTPDP